MTKLLNHDRGFWAIAFALMVVMAYSAFPTPLYGLYAARDGFGALTITAVFAAYAVGRRRSRCSSSATSPTSTDASACCCRAWPWPR